MITKGDMMQEQVVVGCTIESLRYAFKHDLPLVYLNSRPPHRFTDNAKEWHHLYFCLALAGQVLFGDAVTQLRVTEDGLRATVGHSTHTITAASFLIFDAGDIVGLPNPERAGSKNEVLDWINVRSGMRHKHERIESTSDFVKCIHFYPSDRIDGNHNLKDACVVSHLTDEQLGQFEYSELVTRIKTEELMKEAGIRGSGNGVGKYLSLRLESNRREVYPLSGAVYVGLPDGYSVSDTDVGDYPVSNNNYLNYLIKSVR